MIIIFHSLSFALPLSRSLLSLSFSRSLVLCTSSTRIAQPQQGSGCSSTRSSRTPANRKPVARSQLSTILFSFSSGARTAPGISRKCGAPVARSSRKRVAAEAAAERRPLSTPQFGSGRHTTTFGLGSRVLTTQPHSNRSGRRSMNVRCVPMSVCLLLRAAAWSSFPPLTLFVEFNSRLMSHVSSLSSPPSASPVFFFSCVFSNATHTTCTMA